MRLKLAVVLGTRPEVIKLAPVIHEARKRGHDVRVVFSGQHRQMAKSLMDFFGIVADLDLDVMTPNQTLTTLSARVLDQLNKHESKLLDVDYFLVQGDTTTAVMAAYWAFCRRIRVAHVEAGLRTYDLDAPFPEEANRQLIGRIASLHFAPTSQAARSLLQEKVARHAVHSVGNTGIDALRIVIKRLKANRRSIGIPVEEKLPDEILKFVDGHPVALVTAHRRESFGEGLRGICEGILQVAQDNPGLKIVYPVHPNPSVRQTVFEFLSNVENILLCDPLPYVAFVDLMGRSKLLLTDSGGVQEEAPTLRKPILVLRETTERPEGVRAGFAKLVGFDAGKIAREAKSALKVGCRGRGPNPYGDGKSSVRILRAIEKQSNRKF